MCSFLPLILLMFASNVPDPASIIRDSVQANAADFKALPEYSYVTTERSGDSESRTYQVSMMLGSPYRRLIAIDGRALDDETERREARKMQEELEERRKETPEERRERVSKFLKEREQENLMMAEMTRAFQFRLLGTQKLRGHRVYVFDARPNPNYEPPNTQAKVLTGMRGRLWVDAKSHHWVRVEAEVERPVHIEGFLARVDPGTKFVLDQEPVEDNVWLPARFKMQVNSKILGFISHNSSESNAYSQYRRSAEPGQVAGD